MMVWPKWNNDQTWPLDSSDSGAIHLDLSFVFSRSLVCIFSRVPTPFSPFSSLKATWRPRRSFFFFAILVCGWMDVTRKAFFSRPDRGPNGVVVLLHLGKWTHREWRFHAANGQSISWRETGKRKNDKTFFGESCCCCCSSRVEARKKTEKSMMVLEEEEEEEEEE